MQSFLQHAVNGIMLGAIYALIALGYTMVYGVLRLINFAHGDIYMVGAYIGLFAARALKSPSSEVFNISILELILILPVAMLGAAVLGVIIERIAYKPLRKAPRIAGLITAVGVSMLLEYGGQLDFVFGPTQQSFPWLSGAAQPIVLPGGIMVDVVDIVILAVAAGLVAILQVIVHKTKPGKAMRAVAHDREAAGLVGINTDNIISLTFIIGSAFAGAAGVLVGLRNHSIEPFMGLVAGLKAFVAAVVGGIGSIPGAAIGGMIIGISEETVRAVYPQLTDAIVFGILILILVIKPSGIFGSKDMEKV